MEFKPVITRVESICQDAFPERRKSHLEHLSLKRIKCLHLKRRLQQLAANRLQDRCNIQFQYLNEISPHMKPRVQLEDNTNILTLRLPLVLPKRKPAANEVENEHAVKEANVSVELKEEPVCQLWKTSDTIEYAVESLPNDAKNTSMVKQEDLFSRWYTRPDEDPNKINTTPSVNVYPFHFGENDAESEVDSESKFNSHINENLEYKTFIIQDESTSTPIENQNENQNGSSLSSPFENHTSRESTEQSLGKESLVPWYKSSNPKPHGIYCQICFAYLAIDGDGSAPVEDLEPIAIKEHIKRCHPKETAVDIYTRSYSGCRFIFSKCPCGFEMNSRKRQFCHYKAHYEEFVDASTDLVYCSICAEIFHKDYFDTHIATDHEPTGMVPVSRSTASQFCTVCQTNPIGSLASHLYRHRIGTLSISTRPSSCKDAPHYCRACGALFPLYRLNEHYERYHPTWSSDETRSYEFSGDVAKCQICWSDTLTLLALYKHLQSSCI